MFNVNVYTRIYKMNRLCDSKRATFSNGEKALEFCEKLMENPNYRTDGFSIRKGSSDKVESYTLNLRRVV